MKAFTRHLVSAALLASVNLSLAGCSGSIANPQPSYADLVDTYNGELETLERLEKRRADLIAGYQAKLRPEADQAIQALTDVLNSAGQPGGQLAADGAADPQAALDRAVASAEQTQQVTSQLLDAAMQSAQEGKAHAAEYPEELQRELAALDEEIESQRARVERARAARDAAEPK